MMDETLRARTPVRPGMRGGPCPSTPSPAV